MQGESVRRVVEPFPHVTGAWISRQKDFVFCITRGCVIGGSYFRFGMAAFVILQLRSEEGWHHEDNRP